MKSDIELLKEYEIEECYVISRKRNNHVGYKEYFAVRKEIDEKNGLCTFTCEDSSKILFKFTINILDVICYDEVLKCLCEAITKQSAYIDEPDVTYKYETDQALRIVLKDGNGSFKSEIFTYKYTMRQGSTTMCVCQLKDRRLVRLPKTPSCMELTQQYFGSYGELICLLQNYGFTIAKRACPN